MASMVMNMGSPLNRNLERLIEDAQLSGELRISSRRLREFPKVALKYNLNDTVYGDLSKNKLSELPIEVTGFSALEKLSLYHNVIRSIPEAVVYLQCLTYLDLSRNQLSVLPAHLCKLPLQVLLVSHNRLVSLPEEISQLTELIELDASSNQLSHLPLQLGDLQHLEALNLRKNSLVELPRELMFLKLVTLDISLNRISNLPVELRFMVSLVELYVEHNPLTSPPAHLCTRGRIHIFKYLEMEAIKEDRKRGILDGAGTAGAAATRSTPGSTLIPRKSTSDDIRRSKRFNSNAVLPAATLPHPQNNGFNGGAETVLPSWAQVNTNGHSAPDGPPPLIQRQPSPIKISPIENEEEDEDEEGKEERRRAARKILEHQMATQEEQRMMPGHVQTYREYKEALRQQRGGGAGVAGNLYKGLGSNSHTPSPDTPPGNNGVPPTMTSSTSLTDFGRPPIFNQNSVPTTPTSSHPPGLDLNKYPTGSDFNRPLTLNLTPSEVAVSVKTVQKEAVLSYVKAKISPSSIPPPSIASYRPHNDPSPSGTGRKLPNVPSSPRTTNLQRQNSQNGNHHPVMQTPPSIPASGLPPTHYTAASASFTVRREMERQREEMEQIQQLRQVIESRLKVSLPDDLSSALTDGVVLCHLVNHVRPRSVLSIHVPSPAVPKLTVAKCRRNVENFIDACRRIGVPEDSLCTWEEVVLPANSSLEATTARHLLDTVHALLKDDPSPLDNPIIPDNTNLNENNNKEEAQSLKLSRMDLIVSHIALVTVLLLASATYWLAPGL